MVAQTAFSLSNVPLFQGLSMDMLAPLWASCRTLSLEKNDILFHQGDKGKDMYIIQEGKLRIWSENEDGHALELATLGSHEVVGELEIIDGEARSANAQALEPTRLIALPRDAFFNHLGSYPGMAEHMMVILSSRLRANNRMQLQLHRTHKPDARLAQLVLILAGESLEIQNPDLDDMAFVLNMETQAVERMLKLWEDQGILRWQAKDTLVIVTPKSLKTLIA